MKARMTQQLERLGEERRLIFENVANGVPIQQVMSVFRRSETEVMREVSFVGRKIAEYRFRRHLPPLACATLNEIRWNRLALLDTVRKLGNTYLSSSLLLPKIHTGQLTDPHVVREAQARGAVRVKESR
jgi:hypothetical protein